MTKKTKKIFKSSSMESAHELASALFRSGNLSKSQMRDFDKRCLKNNADTSKSGSELN